MHTKLVSNWVGKRSCLLVIEHFYGIFCQVLTIISNRYNCMLPVTRFFFAFTMSIYSTSLGLYISCLVTLFLLLGKLIYLAGIETNSIAHGSMAAPK